MNAENDYIRAGQRGSLDDSPNAGKAKRSKSMGDLDSKEIEMLSEFVTLSLKIGYTYIQEGICDFQQWSKAMKDGFVANTSLFTVLNLTNAEVDKFIEDTWNSPFTMDGETKLLKEWAFVQKIGRKSDTQCIKENDISSNQKITDNSIPRDENGEYLFTQVPAEQTYAYLNAQEDLTPKEVEMFVNLNIQKAQKRIKKLESKRPKTTSDLNEYLANKAKWEVERQQAQADFDYWNQVKAIRKGKKARCHSKISFNRTIVWLLSFLLLFFIALILFLNQRTDQKEESLNEENSCAYSVVSNFVKYQVITKDGKRRGAKKSDVEKYGWSGYAKAYPGAKVRMKDNDNRDYAVPIDKVDYASGEGLRLFTIQVVNIAKHQPKSVGDKVIKYQITMEDGKVHNVSKTNIEKYGWRGYAEEYPGATVRMRDVNNEDYDVPIDKVEYALSKNFRLFSIQFNTIKDKKSVLINYANGYVAIVIIAVVCILAGIWIIALKTKKKGNNKVDVKTNTFSIKTSPTKKHMSQRSLYMKKGFYYLILILLWMLCVLLMGLLFILFSMAPVVSWSYSIGIACAQPFVWLISLGIVLLLRPFVYKFMFKEKKAFSRTIAVVLLVFGVLFMIFKIGNAIYSRYVMDQLIENYDWKSKYGQSKDEIFKK